MLNWCAIAHIEYVMFAKANSSVNEAAQFGCRSYTLGFFLHNGLIVNSYYLFIPIFSLIGMESFLLERQNNTLINILTVPLNQQVLKKWLPLLLYWLCAEWQGCYLIRCRKRNVEINGRADVIKNIHSCTSEDIRWKYQTQMPLRRSASGYAGLPAALHVSPSC